MSTTQSRNTCCWRFLFVRTIEIKCIKYTWPQLSFSLLLHLCTIEIKHGRLRFLIVYLHIMPIYSYYITSMCASHISMFLHEPDLHVWRTNVPHMQNVVETCSMYLLCNIYHPFFVPGALHELNLLSTHNNSSSLLSHKIPPCRH